jgi:hypothetical protein
VQDTEARTRRNKRQRLFARYAKRNGNFVLVSDFRKNRVKVRKLRQEIGRRVPLAYSSSKTPISVVASLSKNCKKKRTMPGN